MLLTICEICLAIIVIMFTGVILYSCIAGIVCNVMNRKNRKIDRKEKNKMTEKQIMQALKICRTDNSCTKCPYYSASSTTCMSQLASDALNLIQKQREEINELTGKHYNECGQIARYSDELNQFADIGKMYSEIRAEAIKEFAKELIINLDGDIEAYANAGHGLNVYKWLVSYLNSKGAIENEHWKK